MADSDKHKSRSKERSCSRTATDRTKRSKGRNSTSSSSSEKSCPNISIKRKSTSCSKDKRKKSRRYSSSPSSSRSSSSSSSSSSSPRKDTQDTKKGSSNQSGDKSLEKRSPRSSREGSRPEEEKPKDDKASRSRSRSARRNDIHSKQSSYYQKTEFYRKEEPCKDWQSERERCTIRTRDRRYGDNRHSLGVNSTEEFRDHGRSRVRNEKREASRDNERRNFMPMNDEESNRPAKKNEDELSIRNRGHDSRERSVSSSKNKAKKSKKRRSSSSSSGSGDESRAERKHKKRKKIAAKKLKKALKREKKREKKLKKKLQKSNKEKPGDSFEVEKVKDVDQSPSNDRLLEDISVQVIQRAKCMAPMTKEQWEKKQSIIRRVYDEETGRHRLIKGGGEVLEEIVSRDRHREINRQATRGDGEYFQSQLRLAK